jgi:hypothetical protein
MPHNRRSRLEGLEEPSLGVSGLKCMLGTSMDMSTPLVGLRALGCLGWVGGRGCHLDGSETILRAFRGMPGGGWEVPRFSGFSTPKRSNPRLFLSVESFLRRLPTLGNTTLPTLGNTLVQAGRKFSTGPVSSARLASGWRTPRTSLPAAAPGSPSGWPQRAHGRPDYGR